MNAFKKIFEDLRKRLRFDVRFKDRGICFNVDLDPKGERMMSLGGFGLDNKVGGALLCVLESRGETVDSQFVPAITNTANQFLFLNGMLLPDNVSRDTTLANYLGIGNMKPSESFRNSVELNRGYTFHFAYIPVKHLREDRKVIEEVVLDTFNSLMPADKTISLISCTESDDDSDLTCDMLSAAMEEFSEQYKTLEPPEDYDLSMVVSYLATYTYSNILIRVHGEMEQIITTCKIPDIPYTNNREEQVVWLDKLKKSVKDNEVWKKFEETFVR